ncbi:galactosyl transferase [Paenibacillus baekrokdamisoli]|uniref:Galactosyl transferase n=2 Tax=Paenibacillus baekrokdamisoli TaxID=1712516 RepID=A0A3G9JJ32_9BACL|nr:sugar transferase [Paenibacillus baekrokdamisoli]MBB3067968.1 exopolysaccharide biosynthesis polyprenyl glycosylphosphotransferase [Paenibacillus baekrokdamisoli]BBH22984.1 galactosyl transferase [Paenibacillus baekrokdamisoli]
MHKFNNNSFFHFSMLFCDVAAVIISFCLSYQIVGNIIELHEFKSFFWMFLIFIALYTSTMNLYNMYNKLTFTYYDRIIRNVFNSVLIATLSILLMIYFQSGLSYSRHFFFTFIGISFLLVISFRTYFTYSKKRTIGLRKRVLVVGVQNVIEKFEYYVNKTNVNIDIIGYVELNSESPLTNSPLLGKITDLEQILRQHVVDEVFFAIGDKQVTSIENHVALCENMGVTSRLILDLYSLSVSKSHFTGIGTLPMLTLHTVSLNDFQLYFKRILDLIGSIVGILITAFLFIFLYPLIKLDSKGPALFAQKRVGINGRVFNIYKFRTMQIDAEQQKQKLMNENKVDGGFMFKMNNDPRVTRVGQFLRRTSLDELPQFFNIFLGHMSLVGTRPPTLDEVKRYETHHYRRISIKPGLTGMWQITGRSEITNFDQVVKLDTEYIDQWSIWLDVKIIIKTIMVVFNRKGAY